MSIGGMTPSLEAFPDSRIALYRDTIAPSSSILTLHAKEAAVQEYILYKCFVFLAHLSRRSSSSDVITAASRLLIPEVGILTEEERADVFELGSGRGDTAELRG